MLARVYYGPGGSSCAKTKELLSSGGVKFEPGDIEAKPEASQDLARHGFRTVSAVLRGDRAFHGWNPLRLGLSRK